MSQHPVHFRLVHVLRQARSHLRGGHVVALSAVAVMAFGLVGLRAVDLPGPRTTTEDGRLRIEVVYPVEPEIVPGSPMDVGELVDGFEGLPAASPSLTDVLWAHEAAGPDDIFAPSPPIRRAAEVAIDGPPQPSPAPSIRAGGRWFGFDEPRRDYGAERAARRARLEAMDRRARLDGQAGRREWIDRDGVRWREVGRPREERLPELRLTEEAGEAGGFTDRESFTGLQ